MIAYLVRYHGRLSTALSQHLVLLIITLVISITLASLITLLLLLAGNKRITAFVLRLFGAIYSIPSVAFFAMLIPFLGIGLKTAVFVLVLYNQFLLIRNFIAGLAMVDPILIEAAMGMGMTPLQVLLKIKLPLAFPVIMAGIRLAVISTIGIGTIAAIINAGGIGAILMDGLQTMNSIKIVWGTILASGLAIGANAILGVLERIIRKKTHNQES